MLVFKEGVPETEIVMAEKWGEEEAGNWLQKDLHLL